MILIRHAASSDYTVIAKLHSESWKLHYKGILSNDFLNNKVEQYHLETWRKRLDLLVVSQQIIVAVASEKIVGFACVFVDDDMVFGSLLDKLHVTNNERKTGVGKLLMKHCAEIVALKSNHPNMYLWVYERNESARIFYERMAGSHFETLEKKNIDGTYAAVCRYVWNDVAGIMQAGNSQ